MEPPPQSPESSGSVVSPGATRGLRNSIFGLLLLLCPVAVTDFLVSGGVVPISYVLFYFLVLYPSLYILAYWITIPYALLFYWASGVLAKKLSASSKAGRSYAITALLVVLGAVSLSPVYVPLRHGQGEWQNIVSLFWNEWTTATTSNRPAR